MLVITSDRLSHSRKRRQVTYQPERKTETDTDTDRSMADIMKEHDDRDTARKRNLSRRFDESLRNNASVWQHSYIEG